MVRDPDGGLVEARQGTPAAVSAAKAPGEIIDTSIGISVARLPRALAFYHGLLGLSVGRTRTARDRPQDHVPNARCDFEGEDAFVIA